MHATIVSAPSGDWEALYIDGTLAEQGHSVRLADALKAVGVTVGRGEFIEDEFGDIDVTWELEDARTTALYEVR